MIRVEVILPPCSDDAMSEGLRLLTRELQAKMPGNYWGGLLGGEDGYGVDFENDVFLMKRYCWCEKAGECPWCTGCAIYQESGQCRACADGRFPHAAGCKVARCSCGAREKHRAAVEIEGCAYHFGTGIFARFAPWTLDHERPYYDPPNFWHKPTNLRVKWYKYIGRDMETNRNVTHGEWDAALRSTLESIDRLPTEDSVPTRPA